VAPSVQRRKVWLTPTTRCRAETLPRRKTSGNLQEYPKLVNRSQPLVGRSSPYYGDMWRTYCCLVAKIKPDKVVRWCPDDDLWRLFCVLRFQLAACSRFQTCILNSHRGHTMCGSMADIQSVAAEIRRGKKRRRRRRKNKPQHENIMVCPIT